MNEYLFGSVCGIKYRITKVRNYNAETYKLFITHCGYIYQLVDNYIVPTS